MTGEPLVHSTHDALAPLDSDWKRLAADVDAPPFARPGWIAPWWEAFGRGRLELHAARRGGRLVGVAAMQKNGSALRSATNAHTPDFCLLSQDEAAADGIAASLFDGSRRVLVEALTDTRDCERLRNAADAAGFRLVRHAGLRSPVLELGGSWEEYQGALPSRLRRDLRRRRHRLADIGPLDFQISTGDRDLHELLEEGFGIEHSGWKDRTGTAIHASVDITRFYTSVAQWAASNGWLRLAFLRVGGQAAAFQYAFEHAGTYYFLKGGFEPTLARFAPGRLLLQETIKRAFAIGLTRFEFLGADEPWKLEWTRDIRERNTLDAFAPSLLGTIEWMLHSRARPLGRRVRAALAERRR